jgi:Regulator of ribonuclease activity B
MPLFKRKPTEEPVDLEAYSEVSGLRNKDILLMGQMVQGGADLNQPRHALYYLYLPTPAAADDAVARGTAAGYTCDARAPLPDHPEQWCVVCERPDAVLDVEGVKAADALFQGIADGLGGEFDGWEAALRP